MGAMIFDSSTWINFLKGRELRSVNLLTDRLNRNESIYTCPPILQEVLQGILEDDFFNRIKYLMLGLEVIQANDLNIYIGAADLYRTLRKKGVTIRKPNDCLIAWYAIQFDLTRVHDNKDFDLIALHSPLKVFSHP